MQVFQEIFQEYFLKPINTPGIQGYNLVNTTVYVGALLAIAFFVVFPALNKRGLKFNQKFALALLPYIFVGSALRLLVSDNCTSMWMVCFQKVLNPLETGFWFFTPGVWITTFIITVIGLGIAKKMKGENYEKAFGIIGVLALSPVLLIDFLHFSNWAIFIGTLALILAVAFVVKFIIDTFTKTELMKDRMNFLALTGQVVDGTATAVATAFFGFTEQHPLSAGIVNIHPALFVIIKIVLILLILHFAENDIKQENTRGFFKLFLIILGFATGTASLLKLGI